MESEKKGEVTLKPINTSKEFNSVLCHRCHKVHGANKSCNELLQDVVKRYLGELEEKYRVVGLSQASVSEIDTLINIIQSTPKPVLKLLEPSRIFREFELTIIKNWFIELMKVHPELITHSEWHLAETIYKSLGLDLPESISRRVE